jgi:glycerol-3-phosphate cytidylyltransferase
MKTVITYGTFDILHPGHVELLKKAKELGDYLIVAISTDEFNQIKNKQAYNSYLARKTMIEAIKYVDMIIPEETWEQKIDDIKKYNVDILVMGDDWKGSDKFTYLEEYVDVVFIPRIGALSTTKVKQDLADPNINKFVKK